MSLQEMKMHKYFLAFSLCVLFGAYTLVPRTIKYDVPDIVCADCIQTISKYLIERKGLSREQIRFNMATKQVDITFKYGASLSKEDLQYILVEAGYKLAKTS